MKGALDLQSLLKMNINYSQVDLLLELRVNCQLVHVRSGWCYEE